MSSEFGFLAQLEDIIDRRIENPSAQSYTSQLVQAGDRRVAQKVGEEAVELALAATTGNAEEQLDEAADLLFHILVLLRTKGLSLGDVSSRLRQRHKASS